MMITLNNLVTDQAQTTYNPKSINVNSTVVSCQRIALISLVAGFIFLESSAQAMLPTPEPAMSNLTHANNTPMSQGSDDASSNLIASRVSAALVSVDAQGNEVLVPVTPTTQLQSGNVIEYQTYLTNNNNQRLRQMAVTMTIPPNVKLIGNINPHAMYASLDNTSFNRMPIIGKVNGQVQEVPMQYYKALKWKVEGIGTNETTKVSYRAVVR